MAIVELPSAIDGEQADHLMPLAAAVDMRWTGSRNRKRAITALRYTIGISMSVTFYVYQAECAGR